MATEQRDVELRDGRTLRTYDSGAVGFVLLWHHGSPQTGAPLAPLLTAAASRGIRLVTYARPSYGGSTPDPGRTVASAGSDVEQLLAALGVERFATMGASGGGPHALACAAAMPDRVTGVACLAGIAPPTDEFPWYDGMLDAGGLKAARQGRPARAAYAEAAGFDPAMFTAADWAALDGPWSSLGADAGAANSEGPDGLIDDDVAFARPWGLELQDIAAPVLLVQGSADRVVPPAHARWMAGRLRTAELWSRPDDGHISVLDACPSAMDWLMNRAGPASESP